MAKDFFLLNRRVASVKLGAAKSCRFFYRPAGGVPVERDGDIEQLQRVFKNDTRMKMRVRRSDSHHTVVVTFTRKLQYGYEVFF